MSKFSRCGTLIPSPTLRQAQGAAQVVRSMLRTNAEEDPGSSLTTSIDWLNVLDNPKEVSDECAIQVVVLSIFASGHLY